VENKGITGRIAEWAKSPYRDEMSVGGWFLFIGMLAVLTFLWSRILRAIAINS